MTSKDDGVEEPEPEPDSRIGTAAQVHRVLKTPDGTMRLLVQGLERVRILEYTQEQPFLRARIEMVPETLEEGIEMEALMRAVQELFRKLIDLEPQMPDELAVMSINVDDGRQLAYLVASSMRLKLADAQALLEMDSVRDKLLRLTQLLKKEVEVLELGRKIPVRGARRDGAHAARLLPARADEGHPEGAGRGRRTGRRHPRVGGTHHRRGNERGGR